MTIWENWLSSRSRSSPHKIAIQLENSQISYSQLKSLVKNAANWFKKQNLPKKTKIAVLLPNVTEFIVIIHALIQSNLVLVLINIRLTSQEIKWQLEEANVDALVVSNETFALVEKISNRPIYSVDPVEGTLEIDFSSSQSIGDNMSEIISREIQCLVFTSGTTGRPKIVPLTFRNHFYSALSSAYHLGVNSNDKWLLVLPLYHLGGLSIVFRSVLYGITIVLHKNFSERDVIKSIEVEGITRISLVPSMLKRLIPILEIQQIKNLQTLLIGGGSAPVSLVAKSIKIGLPIVTTYGMTETSSQFATSSVEKVIIKPTSAGKPLLFNNIRIFDMNREGIGEIGVMGPAVMSGYYDKGRIIKESFREDYFLTGDLGYVDEEGDLYVLQRRTDLIISGGENIYPIEIERILSSIDGIDVACVISLPNPKWGQIPVAILKTTETFSKTQINEILKQQLAQFKLPKHYYSISEFPMTASGKIIRSKLKQKLEKNALERIE